MTKSERTLCILLVLSLIANFFFIYLYDKNKEETAAYTLFHDTFINNYYRPLGEIDDYLWVQLMLAWANEDETDDMIRSFNALVSGTETIQTDTVTEAIVDEGYVLAEYSPGVVLIRFHVFEKDNLRRLAKELAGMNLKDDTLILDLTNNRGGEVEAMEDFLSLFMKEGTLLYSVETQQGTTEVYSSRKQTVSFREMYILTSRLTASAAEVFSLSMRSHFDHVTLLGETTCGKLLRISSARLDDDSVVSFVSGIILGPNGERLQSVGLTPDILFEITYGRRQINGYEMPWVGESEVAHLIGAAT